MDLSGFIAALIADWTALMSGAAGIILTVVGLFRGQRSQRQWFWALGLICVLVAAVRIWTNEHRALIEEQAKNTPVIKGRIAYISVFPQKADAAVLLVPTVSNIGSPSTLDGWQLEITVPGQRPIGMLAPVSVPAEYKLQASSAGQPGYAIYASDSLYDKTAEIPIPKGGTARGVMLFIVPNHSPQDITKSGTVFTLKFSDVLGRPIYASQSFTKD